jgi:hypothetical protein
MEYKIESKSDITSGNVITVTIPEADVDRKALLTILSDCPEFIVPFTVRTVGGDIELTYRPKSLPLKFFTPDNNNDITAYKSFYNAIIAPIWECGEWFLTAVSFVFDKQYMFYDKQSGVMSFIYIPSRKAVSDSDSLRNLMIAVNEDYPSADVNLQNAILALFLRDFSPKNFMNLLDKFDTKQSLSPASQEQNISKPQSAQPSVENRPTPIDKSRAVAFVPPQKSNADDKSIDSNKKPKTQKSERKSIFGFMSKNSENKSANNAFGTPPVGSPSLSEYESDVTEIDSDLPSDGIMLRYSGSKPGFPDVISVDIAVGKIFTVGRFDVSVGKKVNDFEFEKATKGVSRRHAAIERNPNGYTITDLTSSGGTFCNGVKIPAGSPIPFERGNRISFGTSGADYIVQ